jgi:Ca2+-binding RTX toxin-like protein
MTNGTAGPDTMIGTSDADILDGLGGDDRIDAGTIATETTAGTYDFVYGGLGTDTFVVSAAGDTQGLTLQVNGPTRWVLTSVSGDYRVDAFDVERVDFTGGSGADYINTGARGGKVDGGGGNDHWLADLSALSANITFTTGLTGSIAAAGLTSISGIEKTWLTTGSGHDSLTGGSFADSLVAGDGDDVLNGGARSGEAGSDFIDTGSGGVIVNGGGGFDTWKANLGALSADIRFEQGTTSSIGAAGLLSIANVEKIGLTTGSGKDTLTGGAFADSLVGGAGNDQLNARARVLEANPSLYDTLDGGAGVDTFTVECVELSTTVSLIVAGSPNWYVTSASNAYSLFAYNMEKVKFRSGSGDDYIDTAAGGVIVDGGSGVDHWLANYGSLAAKIVFELGVTTSIAPAGLISIDEVEKISLGTGSGKDKVTGGDYADMISTWDGNDLINAGRRSAETGGAYDTVYGGEGVDTLSVDATAETGAVNVGWSGSAFFITSTSNNIKVDAFSVERVRLFGGQGNDAAAGGDQWDTFTGGGGNDTLSGAGGADALEGDNGNDSLFGGAGSDFLGGGGGDDVLMGGDQADYLFGGGGRDTMTGGLASDTFAFRLLSDSGKNTPDLITDLGNSDTIDLSMIDANSNSGGDQAFTIVAAFSGVAGEAALVFSGGSTTLSLDVNGDAKADSVIAIAGDHDTHGAFVL